MKAELLAREEAARLEYEQLSRDVDAAQQALDRTQDVYDPILKEWAKPSEDRAAYEILWDQLDKSWCRYQDAKAARRAAAV